MKELKVELDHKGLGSVLCADDDLLSLDIMTRILGKIFTAISSAPDGLSGLKVYEESKPSFVLTDVSMPEMDGIEMVKAIQSKYKGVKVIFITGHDDDYFRDEFKKLNARSIIKPLDRQELIRIIKELIN